MDLHPWSFRGALSIEHRPSTRSASETVIESLPYTIMKSHHSEIVVTPSNGLWRPIFEASGWKRRSQVMKGAAMSGVCQRFLMTFAVAQPYTNACHRQPLPSTSLYPSQADNIYICLRLVADI